MGIREGKPHPANGKLDTLEWYVDWSPTRGTAAMPEGGEPKFVGSMLEWIESLPKGSIVYLETNFEAHNPKLHNAIIDTAKRKEISLRCLPLRVSYKELLIRRGVAAYKEDDFNALVGIRHAVKLGRHLANPRRYEENSLDARKSFMRLRTSGRLNFKDKDIRDLCSILPRYTDLLWEDEEIAHFLGDGKERGERADFLSGYSATMVTGILLAAREALDLEEGKRGFERRMGLFDHGKPSIFRSNNMQRVGAMARREGCNFSICEEHPTREDDELGCFHRVHYDDPKDERRIAIKKWRRVGRRAARFLFHLAKESRGKRHPVNGNVDS